jgi:hypothetical protein
MVRRGGVEAMTQFAQSEGDAAGLTVLRRQVNQPGAYTYVAALLGYGVLPPLALAVLLFGTSERKQWAILWGGLLCGAVAFGRAATLHKSPLVSWIAVIVLGFWFQRGIRVRWLRLVALALALFALLSFLYSWIYGTSYSAGVQSSWDRVTLIPQLCLSLFVKTFPAYHDFMHGHSIGLYHNLVSTEPFVAGQQVVQAYLGTRSTTPNSVWIADGWADFGWAGVVISSLIAGFVLRYLETVLLNMPRSPLSRAGYAFLLVSCISMASQSVPAALLTGGVGIGPIAVLALWWLRPKSRQTAPETKHRLAVAARQGLP